MNDPIDKADEHPSWENDDKPEDFDGMKDALPEDWRNWVVKLEFVKDGKALPAKLQHTLTSEYDRN